MYYFIVFSYIYSNNNFKYRVECITSDYYYARRVIKKVLKNGLEVSFKKISISNLFYNSEFTR